ITRLSTKPGRNVFVALSIEKGDSQIGASTPRNGAARRGGLDRRRSPRVRSPGKIAGRAVLVLCALVAIAVVPIACGSSAEDTGSRLVLRGTSASFPDYLDPSLSYSLEGVSAMWETYVPLLTYVHANGAAGTTRIPGRAPSLPRITGGGRTYSRHRRGGLRYSDGRPVRASD